LKLFVLFLFSVLTLAGIGLAFIYVDSEKIDFQAILSEKIDIGEAGLNLISSGGERSQMQAKLEQLLEANVGRCQPVRLDKYGKPEPREEATRIPFSSPVSLTNTSEGVFCQSMSSPRPILIRPTIIDPEKKIALLNLTLKRRPKKPLIVSIFDGEGEVVSDQLQLILRLKAMDVEISSENAAKVIMGANGNGTYFRIESGKVSVLTVPHTTSSAANEFVDVFVSGNSSLSVNGKAAATGSGHVIVMPAGFRRLDTPPEATHTPAPAPASPNKTQAVPARR
jgi:hypothetical protein